MGSRGGDKGSSMRAEGDRGGLGVLRGLRFGCAALGVLGFVLTFASPALAGPPSHLHNSALDLDGLDKPCGIAVDSEGDIYVSSAGESKVKIFAPDLDELTSISNANEPCGLAVNSKGELYAGGSRRQGTSVVRKEEVVT